MKIEIDTIGHHCPGMANQRLIGQVKEGKVLWYWYPQGGKNENHMVRNCPNCGTLLPASCAGDLRLA